MDSRMLWIGMVSLALVLVLGYMLGHWTAPDRPDDSPEESAAGDKRSVRRPAGGTLDPGTSQQEQRVAQLEGELALQKLRKETLEYELYGEPIPWPEETPEKYEPKWFEDNLRRAVEECAPDVEIVGIECSEPPCLVLLREGERGWRDRLINECPGWVDHYGSSVSSSMGSLECAGGGEERYNIIGPSTVGWLDQDPETKQNRKKRWTQRVEEARFNWECAGAGSP